MSAGGGNRTHTSLTGPRILSPVRLPVPPPRQVVTCLMLSVSYGDSCGGALVECPSLSPQFVPAASRGPVPPATDTPPLRGHCRHCQPATLAQNRGRFQSGELRTMGWSFP